MNKTDTVTIPEHIKALLNLFEYYANIIKLDYLQACCDKKFNQAVLDELCQLYQKEPATVLGGMNEAFRWHLGCDDYEKTEYYPGTDIPCDCTYPKRIGFGILFEDFDPLANLPALMLRQVSQALVTETSRISDLTLAAAILAEFMAVKVSMHDIFIHGRGDMPASNLLDTSRVEAIITALSQMPVNSFRLKFALSMAITKGIDPARCVLNNDLHQHADSNQMFSGLVSMLKAWREIDLDDFFRWDVFGICAFIEGPIYLRKHPSERLVCDLSQAWQKVDWSHAGSATEVSRKLSESTAHIILDHSVLYPYTTADHFITGSNHDNDLRKVLEARKVYTQYVFGTQE